MGVFEERLAAFEAEFGAGRKMVLATVGGGRVSARMMSVVRIGGLYYFQTDRLLPKYAQLTENPRAALCADNIQLEGVCREVGRPTEHAAFAQAFAALYPASFAMYTALENERLFALAPTLLERWVYKEKLPYVETLDFERRAYSLRPYRL